jgi:hypothetical protein
MYEQIRDWLVYKEGRGEGTANGRRYEKTLPDWGEAADAWRIKVKLEAKQYGVKVPWKWNWS